MARDAVIVGINLYRDAPLAGCVRDANDMAACLTLAEYGFHCLTFVDSQATRARILSALGQLIENETPADTLVIFFAGHGQVLGDQGYLVTIDGTPYDPGIALSHLGGLMEAASRRYRHVLLILDSCHSGSSLSWSNSRPLTGSDVDREVRSANESRCILAACRPEELALESGGQGVFTKEMLNGLLGNAVDFDGNVSVFSLFDYIAKTLPSSRQTPVFKGDAAGSVILGRNFPPRLGRPLTEDATFRTLRKAESLIEEYYPLEQRELGELGHRKRVGARRCGQELAPILRWFDETEVALPEIRRSVSWQDLVDRVRQAQGRLADISPGQETEYGRVSQRIGHGGFGHVWALDGPDGSKMAYKVFHGNELDDQIKVKRFSNGFKTMRRLNHPRIVRVHQLTEAPYGFTMDAVPGQNLRDAYFDRRESGTCIRLMIEISETVLHAHNCRVLHRDIKPENIILTTTSEGGLEAYLTDFDLAYHETNRTITMSGGSIGGVLNYAAPEQLFAPNTRPAREEAVDVFALGQLMFFIICGRDPVPNDWVRNYDAFRRALNDWTDERAAVALLSAYGESTKHEPSERTENVTDFISKLSRAESFILAASGQDVVDELVFCRKIGHLHSGMENYHASEQDVTVASLSGQVDISVRLAGYGKIANSVNLELTFSMASNLTVGSFKSGADARTALNRKLDRLVSSKSNIRRRSGKSGSFQVFFDVQDITLDLGGAQDAVELIREITSSIERR
ncbi:caspase family protein [Kineococcus gynurae]|uniref:Caspase family protein n=1 Tax=Kineococcus gynurae TaxID=452979 RepID=A0ABV5LXJ0_9ACTN